MTPMVKSAARLRLGAIAAVLLLPLAAITATQQPPAKVDQRGPQFRSNVDLVRLSVTARDTAAGIIHDLGSAEFEIYEDGVRQEVGHFGHHETPISVVLLLDKSGSMFGDKIMHAKDAVINFVNALKPGDEALLIAFSDSVAHGCRNEAAGTTVAIGIGMAGPQCYASLAPRQWCS